MGCSIALAFTAWVSWMLVKDRSFPSALLCSAYDDELREQGFDKCLRCTQGLVRGTLYYNGKVIIILRKAQWDHVMIGLRLPADKSITFFLP